jgi:acetate kinase
VTGDGGPVIGVIKAGSSSLKCAFYDGERAIVSGQIGAIAATYTPDVWEQMEKRWTSTLELEDRANQLHGPRISAAASRIAALCLPADEKPVIARHTRILCRN